MLAFLFRMVLDDSKKRLGLTTLVKGALANVVSLSNFAKCSSANVVGPTTYKQRIMIFANWPMNTLDAIPNIWHPK